MLLELTRSVFSSNHLDTRKIAKKIAGSGSYQVSDFEAVKTLLYGDYDQYSPANSIFVNLFDLFYADPKEHFLRILILDYLNRVAEGESEMRDIAMHELNAYLESYYFDPLIIRRHIDVLNGARCLAIESIDRENVHEERIRVTTKGQYHISNLVKVFQYVDAMVIDTPILDGDVRRRLVVTNDIFSRSLKNARF